MNRCKYKSKDGASLIVVFIICTVIAILLSTTFIVTSNYNGSVLLRKKELIQKVKADPNNPEPETGE